MKIPHVVDHESGCADGTTDALQQYEDIQVCQPIAMTSGARSYDIIMCDRHCHNFDFNGYCLTSNVTHAFTCL